MRNEYISTILKHSSGRGYNNAFKEQEWANQLSPLHKQKLSPAAAKAKAVRDLAYAKTEDRKNKKADSQRRHRKDPKGNGKDWDHEDGRWENASQNRGNDGNGTKSESGKKYKINKNS